MVCFFARKLQIPKPIIGFRRAISRRIHIKKNRSRGSIYTYCLTIVFFIKLLLILFIFLYDYQYVWFSRHNENDHVGYFIGAQDFRCLHLGLRQFRSIKYLCVHETGADALRAVRTNYKHFCLISSKIMSSAKS